MYKNRHVSKCVLAVVILCVPARLAVAENIDPCDDGSQYAYGENIGWIHFRSQSPVAYKVQTSWITSCEVDYDDLKKFVADWLESGGEFPGDLDNSGSVDFLDYAVIGDLWLELCPAGWPFR